MQYYHKLINNITVDLNDKNFAEFTIRKKLLQKHYIVKKLAV